MKRAIQAMTAATMMVAAIAASAPASATDVGVSVAVGQPGFYGRLDIGGYPPPVLIYPQPLVIVPGPVSGPPVYLRVPPGHAKHWSKHCHRYDACGERVYFVQDGWYSREYVPRYRERYYEHDRDAYRYRGGGDRDDRGDDRGHGHGKGHKHGHDQ